MLSNLLSKLLFYVTENKCTFDWKALAIKLVGKGQNYKNQNIKIQKEHWKKFKGSEHRKCLFSSSLLRHQNIEKCLFSSSQHWNWLVDHYYKNQNIEKNEKNIESLSFVNFWSYFTYGVSTYGILALKNKSLKYL